MHAQVHDNLTPNVCIQSSSHPIFRRPWLCNANSISSTRSSSRIPRTRQSRPRYSRCVPVSSLRPATWTPENRVSVDGNPCSNHYQPSCSNHQQQSASNTLESSLLLFSLSNLMWLLVVAGTWSSPTGQALCTSLTKISKSSPFSRMRAVVSPT